MAATLYARTYQTVSTEITDPRQTLLLLLEGAVRFLHQARAAMERRDYEGQCQGITRTQRIISTLMTSLDQNPAPDLARSLTATYAWMHGALTEASIRDDLALLDEVIECLSGMHEAWVRAYEQAVWDDLSGAQQAA